MNANQKLNFTPLGAGNEVGRSCMHITYKSTSILLDIGIHPAHTGNSALPYLDLIDLSKVDALFVTHFHLDHAGALPYLTEKTNFCGKVYMTHPTKAILKYLLNDYTRIVNASSEQDFYSETDLENCYNKITSIDYHQEIKIKDLTLTGLNAGHVLGAAMFLIKVDMKKMLYTGDYSTEEDRHLKAATPPGKMNFLITESTYGVQCHLPRDEREKRFTSTVKDILKRGGKVLLPVFALGRAQEILLILEEYWESNQEMWQIPIYYASALAKRCIGIYQTYCSTSKNVNFHFKYIQSITHYEDKNIPCVVMASPGMLQSGLSRDLFEKWCDDERNGVVIAGYCVQGTMAKEILNEPEEIEGSQGNKLKLKCSVDSISFSAHVDYLQNKEFIASCDPEILFLVHGEQNEMNRLKIALKRENVYCLRNGESMDVEINRQKTCRINKVVEGEIFEGIIKGDGEDFEILKVDEIKQIEIVNKIRIKNIGEIIEENQKENGEKNKDIKTEYLLAYKNLPYNSKFSLIKNSLCDFFDGINDENGILSVENVNIFVKEENIFLEWKSNYVSDLLAAAITRVIKNIGKTMESVKLSRVNKKEILMKLLMNHFLDIKTEDDKIIICDGDEKVVISDKIVTGDQKLVERIRKMVENVELLHKNTCH